MGCPVIFATERDRDIWFQQALTSHNIYVKTLEFRWFINKSGDQRVLQQMHRCIATGKVRWETVTTEVEL